MLASRIIDLPEMSDPRGKLSVCEFGRHVPFEVKRNFFVYGVPPQTERGEHAHRQCHQFLICAHGSVKARVDNGQTRKVFDLSGPQRGLYMPPMTWGGQFDYSTDAVLAVFTSHHYDDGDYIRDYAVFLELVSAN